MEIGGRNICHVSCPVVDEGHHWKSTSLECARMNKRWDALDVLRGLTIMLMPLNLSPGSRERNFSPLTHAVWER